MEKMKKTARILDTVMKILQVFAIVAAAMILTADIAYLIDGESGGAFSRSMSDYSLSLNGILITPETATSMNVDFPALLTCVTVRGIILCAVVWFGLRLMRHILGPMKEGRPFDESVSRDFTRFGWFTVIAGVVANVVSEAAKSILLRAIDFAQAEGGAVVGVEHEWDLTFVLIAAFLFLFSYIFRYGEELQRQSDETL